MIWFSSSKISFKKHKNLIQKWMQSEWIQSFITRKELQLIGFFCFLFVIIIIRLVQLQIFDHQMYDQLLSQQHYKESLLDPDRWNIYALDKWGHPVKLTENITLYDLAVDAKRPGHVRGKTQNRKFLRFCRRDDFFERALSVAKNRVRVIVG